VAEDRRNEAAREEEERAEVGTEDPGVERIEGGDPVDEAEYGRGQEECRRLTEGQRERGLEKAAEEQLLPRSGEAGEQREARDAEPGEMRHQTALEDTADPPKRGPLGAERVEKTGERREGRGDAEGHMGHGRPHRPAERGGVARRARIQARARARDKQADDVDAREGRQPQAQQAQSALDDDTDCEDA